MPFEVLCKKMLVINLFPLTDKSPLQTCSLVFDLNVPSTAQGHLRMIKICTVHVSLEKEEQWVTRLPAHLRFHPPPYRAEQTAILHLQTEDCGHSKHQYTASCLQPRVSESEAWGTLQKKLWCMTVDLCSILCQGMARSQTVTQ